MTSTLCIKRREQRHETRYLLAKSTAAVAIADGTAVLTAVVVANERAACR